MKIMICNVVDTVHETTLLAIPVSSIIAVRQKGDFNNVFCEIRIRYSEDFIRDYVVAESFVDFVDTWRTLLKEDK